MADYFIPVKSPKYALNEQDLGLDTVETVFQFLTEARDFFFKTSRLFLGPIQPSTRRITVSLSPGIERQGTNLNTHLHVVLNKGCMELYLHIHVSMSWCLSHK